MDEEIWFENWKGFWEYSGSSDFSNREGPMSLTCDRAGYVTEEDCKTCWGTGGCRYGKTDEEWENLINKKII